MREYERKLQLSAKPPPGYTFARDRSPWPVALIGEGQDSAVKLDQPEARLASANAPSPLYVHEPSDLNDFNLDEVQTVWDRRTELCGTIEAAAEVLAILRAASGADASYAGWRKYLSHEMIVALEDDLPHLDSEEIPATAPGGRDLTDMLTDRRQVAVRNVRLRTGQATFRDEVFAFHHGRCCVTGCRESVLLEAAHIVPYKGVHSHDVQNGLCLRVDIHRLFDAHLVSIEPESFEFLVSPLLSDRAYRAFEGRRLFRSDNAPSRAYLRQHCSIFAAARR
jgi:hypothetical protein